jgi:hypothetical protein
VPEDHAALIAALGTLGERLDPLDAAGADPVTGALRRIAAEAAAGEVPAPASGPGRAHLPGAGDRRLLRRPRRRPAVLVAAVLAVAVLVVAVPGSRAALARWLGIGAVRIVTSDDPVPVLAGPYDLGDPIAVEDAIERAPAPVVPDGVGPPDAAYAGAPTGAVTVVWRASGDLPPIGAGAGDVGLVVTILPGTRPAPLTKVAGAGTVLEAATVAGTPGWWLSGAPHVLWIDGDPGGADGGADDARALRLAGNTLLWADGDLTYRLESALGREAAVELAEGIAGAGDG